MGCTFLFLFMPCDSFFVVETTHLNIIGDNFGSQILLFPWGLLFCCCWGYSSLLSGFWKLCCKDFLIRWGNCSLYSLACVELVFWQISLNARSQKLNKINNKERERVRERERGGKGKERKGKKPTSPSLCSLILCWVCLSVLWPGWLLI